MLIPPPYPTRETTPWDALWPLAVVGTILFALLLSL